MRSKLIEYLQEKEWRYSEGRDPNIITFSLSGLNGIFNCVASIDEKESRFFFITFWGINCPFDKRIDMAVLLNTINSNLIYGH